MKTIAIASLCSLLSFLPALGADGWMTDFEAAKKKAADENKALLIDFTGSDWCGWCIKLREEVFDQEAFSKGVAEHFVLVELDFPKDKSKMSKETIAQNDKLVKEYEVRGYPTIYLTDAVGNPFGQTGYQAGGPEAYLAHLAEFREKLAVRDKALADLEKAKGKARGAALEAVLASVPQQSISKFYGEEFAELSKLKPKAKLVVAIATAEAKAKQDEEKKAEKPVNEEPKQAKTSKGKRMAGKSEEDLRKGLEKARAAHKKAVNRVNNTDGMMAQLGKDAAAREQELKKLTAEAEKAKAALAGTKQKHAVLEKEHNAAHKQEEGIKKMVAAYEAERKKRAQIAELEKQANELREKAEQLRKRAEKLKE